MAPASMIRYEATAGTLQAFREAVTLHDRGRLGEAKQRYESVLRADAAISKHSVVWVFADVGERQQSFDHILAANALKRRQIKFGEGEWLRRFERIRNVFTTQLLRDNAGLGDPSELPVFIIGMPRSGTTLIEQILASHPKVFGAGELSELGKLATRLPRGSIISRHRTNNLA